MQKKVRKTTHKTRGGTEPSGLDIEGWKRLFTSTPFGDSTNDLCNTFAEVIKKLCAVENLSSNLEIFLSCRLIPLDKNPGRRPISVGEMLQQIADKVIVTHARDNIVTSVGGPYKFVQFMILDVNL